MQSSTKHMEQPAGKRPESKRVLYVVLCMLTTDLDALPSGALPLDEEGYMILTEMGVQCRLLARTHFL